MYPSLVYHACHEALAEKAFWLKPMKRALNRPGKGRPVLPPAVNGWAKENAAHLKTDLVNRRYEGRAIAIGGDGVTVFDPADEPVKLNICAREDQQYVSQSDGGVIQLEFNHRSDAVMLFYGFKREFFGVNDQGL
jgi:hypothetical protein